MFRSAIKLFFNPNIWASQRSVLVRIEKLLWTCYNNYNTPVYLERLLGQRDFINWKLVFVSTLPSQFVYRPSPTLWLLGGTQNNNGTNLVCADGQSWIVETIINLDETKCSIVALPSALHSVWDFNPKYKFFDTERFFTIVKSQFLSLKEQFTELTCQCT